MTTRALVTNQLGSIEELADAKTRVMSLLKITTTDYKLRSPNEHEAAEIVQYAFSIGANPFRDIHVWEQRKDGKTHLVKCEDYTLLVRWANQEMAFTPYYRHLTDQEKAENAISPKDAACYCYVLRNDNRAAYTIIYTTNLKTLVEGGIGAREAMELAKYEALEVMATRGIGVFKSDEKFAVTGKPRSWRAETRALRAALRVSHRRPSPLELAQLAWKVGSTETTPDDWQTAEIYATAEERERAAQIEAWNRERQENPMPRSLYEAGRDAMRNNGDDDPLELSPDPVEDGETVELPAGDPDFPGDPHDWSPTFQEFKDQVGFDFGLTWDEAKVILKAGGFDKFKGSDPKAMYNYLAEHHYEFDVDKPLVPHQDGLFPDESEQPPHNYSE